MMCTHPPLTITPVPYFAAAVLAYARPAVEAHIVRRAFSAPEVMEFPDEHCMDWADDLIYAAEPAVLDFVQVGTKEDIQTVLEFFSDPSRTWPAHRKAFFNRLHAFTVTMEQEGRGEVSEAFAYFMRERYMPNYFYRVERRDAPQLSSGAEGEPTSSLVGLPLHVLASASSSSLHSVLVPIQESSQESYDDEDDSFSK